MFFYVLLDLWRTLYEGKTGIPCFLKVLTCRNIQIIRPRSGGEKMRLGGYGGESDLGRIREDEFDQNASYEILKG